MCIRDRYNAEDKKIDINVKQIYSEEALETVETDNAVETVTQIADVQIKEQEKQEEKNNAIAVVNEVAIITKPVSGSITSRYAEVSRVRSGAHTGLDIAAPSGTDIKVCSEGKVTFASYKGSYGNLIKVEHENGVETWYAHCSKLYAKVGQEVKAGDKLVEFDIDLIKKEGYSPDVMVVVLEDSNLPKVAYKTGEKTVAGKTVVAEF